MGTKSNQELKRNTIIFVVLMVFVIFLGVFFNYFAKETNSLRYYEPENISIETNKTYFNETLNESVELMLPLTINDPERVYDELGILLI